MKGCYVISEWVGDGKEFPVDQQIAMSTHWHDEVALGVAVRANRLIVSWVTDMADGGWIVGPITVGDVDVAELDVCVVGTIASVLPRIRIGDNEPVDGFKKEIVDGELTVTVLGSSHPEKVDIRHVYPKTNPDDIKPITDFPDNGPQRPLVADEYPCSCEDVTGQYVRLGKGSPDPNLAVFKVMEIRPPKHDGRIEAIKTDSRFCVLEEFEIPMDGELPTAVQTVSDKDVDTFLEAKKVKKAVRDLVKGDHRVSRACKLFKDFEKPQKAATPI